MPGPSALSSESRAAPPQAVSTAESMAQVMPAGVAAATDTQARSRPLWQRLAWGALGVLSLLSGIVGIFLPLLPTVPFVLLAGFCFARSSTRCERWLLNHARFGPMVRNWRARRAIPLRAKQLAWVMMAIGATVAAMALPLAVAWVPAAVCLSVAIWMARLPNA